MTSQQLADVTWDKTTPPATMSRRELEGISIAMLTLTSLVFVARIVTRVSKRRTFELQDFFCYLSYICYVAMLVMFFKENDPLYRAERVQRGEAPLYPELLMFLPFRMTWNLRLPRAQKLGIFVLFGSGWICIVFATLRVVQVSVKDGLPKIPDPKWLQMWTIIETSMAVIIGCAPAFNALRRRSGHHNVEISSIRLDIETVGGDHTTQVEPYMRVLRTKEQGSEEALHPRGTPGLAF
ncbi:hypothetical protein BKA58DRAFT_461582 [Alternaria rosae]|uniref:uncharacterized protein n=1 Tax=Alternaria rosae TaxID=1187941 RepID=UPI001E8EE473|nr:uncharacterized protein BKA58DRAFT_461582 [Alternaria rosae]KAH6865672.1 hypothetical protein BKA58DRAFT_461582 [Alternaria rosae]